MESAAELDRSSFRLERLPYRALQWMLLALLVVHGIEELIVLTVFRPQLEAIQRAHPAALDPLPETGKIVVLLGILIFVAGAPIVVPVGRKGERARDTLVAAVAVGFFVNALLQHVPRTVLARAYTPGLLSAALLAMPFSVYFVVRSFREKRVSAAGLAVALVVAAAFLTIGLRLIARAAGL